MPAAEIHPPARTLLMVRTGASVAELSNTARPRSITLNQILATRPSPSQHSQDPEGTRLQCQHRPESYDIVGGRRCGYEANSCSAGRTCSEPAWRTKPSWYLVTTEDRMIPPDAQRAMSKRAGATVVEVKGSHAIYVSQPSAVAALIEQAAKKVKAAAA
jgi:pimeloyl-ACP methyl ester carboxylesterase